MSKVSTYTRLLDAAEAEFGTHGFENASLRRITKAAGANLAAVNYHFGSKEELYCEMFLRRVRPINARRLALLDAAVERFGAAQLPPEATLDAFIRPVFESIDAGDQAGNFLRILSRSYHAHQPFMREVMSREFDPIVKRFMQELRSSLPRRSSEDLLWGFLLSSGAMLLIAAHFRELESVTHGLCRTGDLDAVIGRIVRFATNGITS